MDDAIKIDARELLGFGDTSELNKLPMEINHALTRYGIDLENYAMGQFERGYSAGASKSRSYLQNRSGAGQRSFGFEVTGGGAAVDLNFFTTQFYVGVQEFGATISPRSAQYLTIPLEDNLNPSGEAYETATEAIDLGAFFYESSSGDLFIMREDAGVLEALFFLTQGPIEIPKRLGVGEFIDRQDTQRELLRNITRAVLGVTAGFVD